MNALTSILVVLLVVSCYSQPPVKASLFEKKQKQQVKYMMKIGNDTVSTELGQSFARAQELMASQKYAEAETLLQSIVQKAPNLSSVHYKYGFALLQQNKFQETVEQAKICIQLAPNFVGGYSLMGEASEGLNQKEDALTAFKKALALNPSGENAEIIKEHISDLENPQPEPEPEVVDLNADKNKESMKLNQAYAKCNRAKQFFAQRKFADGMQDCRDALTIAPDNDVVRETFLGSLNNYAADCVQHQQIKEAETLMKEAVAFQSQGGVTQKTRMTTLKNYSGLLNFLGRTDEAKKIEAQLNSISATN
jgi:Putative Zn-dependent protease, contains TPR repeats